MNITFRVKGKVLDREGHPVEGLSVKVYDDKGVFIGGAETTKNGVVELECGTSPKIIKLIHNRKSSQQRMWRILALLMVSLIGETGRFA